MLFDRFADGLQIAFSSEIEFISQERSELEFISQAH
jgi:hypothetical protein